MTQNVRLERPWGNGRQRLIRDATANDSDKTVTVPAGKLWKVQYIKAELVNTATVGNRTLQMLLTDGTNTIWTSFLLAAAAANQYSGYELFDTYKVATSTIRRLDNSGNCNQVYTDIIPFSCGWQEGWVLRVWDVAAIDAAADDLTILMNVIEYDV